MQGSKLVVLVPDGETRDRVRLVALVQPIAGLHASIYVAHDAMDVCVRDTRRSLFEGPLAVLTYDEAGSLRALAAGADESFALDSLTLDAAAWARLVARAQQRSEARIDMQQRLASLSELERVCALGRLVTGVADELGAPLNTALLSLQMLKRELDPLYSGMAQLRALFAGEEPLARADLSAIVARASGSGSGSTPTRALEVLTDAASTCEAVVQVASDLDLRDLGLSAPTPGHPGQERHEFIDLRDTLDKILRLFRHSAAKNTHIDRDYADDLPEVLAPRGRVAQALLSLLASSLSSLRDAPRDLRRLRISLRADDAVVTMTVSDTGSGLRTEMLEHRFDSTPPPASLGWDAGSAKRALGPTRDDRTTGAGGLELVVARSIMRSLGGDLLIESLSGAGATYIAFLPRPKRREQQGSGTVRKPDFAQPSFMQGAATRRRVLVLEPSRPVLNALSHLLRERYEVLLALSGEEARNLISTGTKPDALVAAIDDASGRRFVEWLLSERPDLARKLLLTSDLAEPSQALIGIPWLEKPLEPAALFLGIEGRFLAPLKKARAVDPSPSPLANRG